ncbi:MAG: septal ring lytic transglycosylase RlpA family protein [Cardiobacteriaceae bacterium]|nr:septal ring lytic transglycosylase RlpA family protein [Cardiobacteriaceae bacterium]
MSLFALAAHSAEKAPLFTVASDVASLQDSDIGSAKKTGETKPVKLKSKASKQDGKALFQIHGQQAAQHKAAPLAAKDNASKKADQAGTARDNPLQALAAGDKPAESKKAVADKKADKAAVKASAKTEKTKPQAADDSAAKVKTVVAADKSATEQIAAKGDSQPAVENSESTLFKIASYYEADEMGDSDDAVRKIDLSKPQGKPQLLADVSGRRAIADSKAIQRAAPVSKKRSGGKKGSYSYVVRGKRYQTLASSDDFVQEGPASWYGPGFHGKKTASGEIYDMHKMTAAHKRLPLGTKLEVTNKRTGKSIIVTVNDRGPFHGNRIIDLSHAAASKLGVLKSGVANVTIRAIK